MPVQYTIRAVMRAWLGAVSALGFASGVCGENLTVALRFDVVTFCCPCTVEDHLCEPQFDHLNAQRAPGHFLAMGSDARRADIKKRGNELAAYHNDLNSGWTGMTGAQKADQIAQYVTNRFTKTGPRPQWVILNEISAGQWPTNQVYRTWVREVVERLRQTHGHQIVLCAPFQNPGRNDPDWQAVATHAFIGVECYLSGEEITGNGHSVEWCRAQYQKSKDSYLKRGVPASRLFLVEHFGQTPSGTEWGRAGVSADDWDKAIRARSVAAREVGFAGFVSYAWAKNRMKVSDEELIRFEDTYRAQTLP